MQLAGWSTGPEATGHQGEWLSPGSGDCAGRPDAVDHLASLVDRLAATARLEPTDGGVPVLGMLSTSPQRTMRMSSLAEVTNLAHGDARLHRP